MAEVYDLAKVRRRSQSPRMALPESLLVMTGIFGFELPNTFTEFFLRRTKQGTEVHIKGGRLTLNLSHAMKVYPPNFKTARQWVSAVAERHGWQMTEKRTLI